LIGVVGSCIYSTTKRLLERFEIDDPLDNSSIHGFCGIWSILAVGIFDETEGLVITGNMD
jgi:ammonium transporter, Amt family